MGKGGKKQTQTSEVRPDAASQAYINQQRNQAQQGANVALNAGGPGGLFTGPLQQTPGQIAQPFMSPFQDQVVGGIRGEFDHLRNQASMATAQDATSAGAFGGSRQAITEGARLGELDRAQASQVGNVLNQGYQNAMQQGMGFAERQRALQQQQNMEPIWRQQQALQMMNLGMGPTGQTQTTTMETPGASPFGSAAGGAMTGASVGGPWGAAIGGGIGLLGGLLG